MRAKTSPLSEAIETFVRSQFDLRPKTLVCYAGSLRAFDKWLRGGTLADFNIANVNAYVSEKVRAGHKYAARNDVQTLKLFAKWLVEAHIIRENPLIGITVPKVSKRGRTPFNDADVETILRVAGESREGARDKLIVMMALWCGLRLNELRGLRWPEDIDLGRGAVRIREETTKTEAGIRELPIDPLLVSYIERYIKDWRPNQDPGPLFLNQHGKPFTYNGFARVQSRLHDRLKEAGIPDYKIHRMRHTWTTTVHSLGVSVLDLQQMGGWTDLTMVRRYVGKRSLAELRRLPSVSQVFGKAV